jgi:TPR repeat protein
MSKCIFVLAFSIVFNILNAGVSATNQYISNYVFTYIDKNREIVLQYLKENADTIKDASYILGIIYYENGQFDLSNYYMWKAAVAGHRPAINAIGDMYYSDKKDVKNARKYYKKAAKMGYGPSQFNLGIIYLKHYNNRRLARYWLLKAAKNKYDLCDEIREAALKYATTSYKAVQDQ